MTFFYTCHYCQFVVLMTLMSKDDTFDKYECCNIIIKYKIIQF